MERLIWILIIILVVAAFPVWPYSMAWGYYPSGGGLILLLILILMFYKRP